ncbi:PepSY domain-containing protein [Desulfurispirillum indicum]|uniref:PepSY-associated TM helix domain-containing protein n=1 Tax=Desulfurispirillum indicum TaxID=936456 RepID=UPI001CFBB7E5|nr:PepSY-associated TM helix domain-containing protein [Desulfurispirillum indicum]UCZ57321.1 PepSY domain-containing protein [Desulfurispirillum indicum]
MRSEIVRIYRSVHTWTGIIAGLALFIAFYAGSLTIFKESLAGWASPPSAGTAAVSLADVPELMERTLEAHPQTAREMWLHLDEGEHLPARLTWRVRKEGAGGHDPMAMRHFTAILQEDGTPRIEEIRPSQLGNFIDVLHRVIGLPADKGPFRWIMGTIAALYALALVSGVIILLPSLVRDFFALRESNNPRRIWLDSHNLVGMVSLPFHIVMALTATVFAFHGAIYMIQDKTLHQGQLASIWASSLGGDVYEVAQAPSTLLTPTELVARSQAISPSFEPRTLQYLNLTGTRPVVRVWGTDATTYVAKFIGGFVALDPYSGAVMSTGYMPGQQNTSYALISSFFTLHFGTYGGTPVRWIYFLLGLAGAWLFYSGNLLWIEARRRRTPRTQSAVPRQSRSLLIMAALTVGVSLGCVAGISATIVAGKWLHGHVTDMGLWHQIVYYTCFFAAIGWAFLRGPARASTELLWFAAAATLAIPLTSIVALALPSLGLWTHASIASLGVDATALAGSLCFAWMARATAKRARYGPPDSVWSARQASEPQ